MIYWDSIQYNTGTARQDFEKLEIKITSIEPIHLSKEFVGIREKLVKARDDIFDEYDFDYANKLDYHFDLLFGLQLYKILNEEIGFNNRVATDDDIWRYISIKVIPDVIHARWGFNENHFYKVPRRIWLKTIWWYIHIGWQGNEKATYLLLKNNTTDIIASLIERPGIGYYRDVYREILFQHAEISDSSRNLFRRVLKLNTAKLLTTSPELVDGGIKSYVANLFDSVGVS